MTGERRTAPITGITGQDGSYLAELLLEKGYHVAGLYRRSSHDLPNNIVPFLSDLTLVKGDLTDPVSLVEAIKKTNPDEIYNLAAQSHVKESWRTTGQTLEVTARGALNVFDAVRQAKSKARIYQASSSEMFGTPKEIPQTENTPLIPQNPYAADKVLAHNMARIYRDSYGMYIATGILFNHEGPRRGMGFVSQKITYGAACASLEKDGPYLDEENRPLSQKGRIGLGTLDSKRDWEYAGDYVEAMWQILQQPEPEDFIIATGVIHSVKDFCQLAYAYVGLNYKNYVYLDENVKRPTETGPLLGNASKAKEKLGWQPRTSFPQLVEMMVDAHVAKLR